MFNTLKRKISNRVSIYARKMIILLSRYCRVDLITTAYKNSGILTSGDLEKTGERYVIDKILSKYLKDESILFDAGANIGEYSLELVKFFPNANVYSFEPNPRPFTKLNEISSEKINKFNIGLGEENKETNMYSHTNMQLSTLGTMYEDALVPLFNIDEPIEKIKVNISTIDSFCAEKNIDKVNYLKIDVEGHEIKVLSGAKKMISKNMIDIIQFEFNNFNVYSRTFLKDFYDLLKNFNFYRVTNKTLIPLRGYHTKNEIFLLQNILCINKKIDKELDKLPMEIEYI